MNVKMIPTVCVCVCVFGIDILYSFPVACKFVKKHSLKFILKQLMGVLKFI